MTFIRVPLQFFCTALFLDGPPKKAQEGSGSAGRAGLSIHFKISLKNRSALA